MKYRYYFFAIQCNRAYSNFMKSCGLGINDCGVPKEISFITDTEPKEDIIEKIEKLLNSTQKEKKVGAYFRNAKFIKAEVVMEDKV